MLEERTLPAGAIGTWLDGTRRVTRGEADADVPCHGCTACCRASYFVHIEPDEAATLRRIPRELLFPAPGRPDGHVLLGYDEHGRCPMLRDEGCSIYDDRPRTCRAFDCRVFAATGIRPDGEREVDIARRADRWRFDLASDDDRDRLAACRAAAAFLDAHADDLPAGSVPARAADRAVLALRLHELFRHRSTPTVDDIGAALHP